MRIASSSAATGSRSAPDCTAAPTSSRFAAVVDPSRRVAAPSMSRVWIRAVAVASRPINSLESGWCNARSYTSAPVGVTLVEAIATVRAASP